MLGQPTIRPDRFSAAFGERLRSARRLVGLDRAEVIARLRSRGYVLSERSLRRFEDGETDPTSRQITALCSIYSIAPGLVFDTLWRRKILLSARKTAWNTGIAVNPSAIKP
jgi:transcriptional regulator with XRE-family HTH domain